MKPSVLKPGDVITMQDIGNPLIFIQRSPRQGSRPAVNLFRCPAFAGLNGPDDQGFCEVSDNDLMTRGNRVLK